MPQGRVDERVALAKQLRELAVKYGLPRGPDNAARLRLRAMVVTIVAVAAGVAVAAAVVGVG